LVKKLGGRIRLSEEEAVKFISNSFLDEQQLSIIDDFKSDILQWTSGRRSAFFWFYGGRVESVRGEKAALPYFAASVLANPSPEAAAWSKFPNIAPSVQNAKALAAKYPLLDREPSSALTSSRKDAWWKFWKKSR
jgi:hypothetical protein